MTEAIDAGSRQRVSRACDLCRRKKVKCDGATPVCTNCKTVRLQCTFNDQTKKRGPPKGYIEAIENRLYKLEDYLGSLAKSGNIESKDLLSELNSPLETPTGEQIRARPIRRVPRSERNKVFFWQQDKAGKRKRESLNSEEEEEEDDDDEVEDRPISREQPVDEGFGQLSMDENGQVRYLGKSSGYYLLQNSRTYHNGAFHFAHYGNRPIINNRRSMMMIDPLETPPQDLSDHLIQLYFDHFYPFLPLFYKRQLFSPTPSIPAVTPLLLNAIYAVASRISPDLRVRSDPALAQTAGDLFFDRAEKLLDASYDTPTISTVQALLLLSSHQHGAMKPARAWLYSGMAFRMAQDLGLHRNCDLWNISQEERERRKRVFWCCYIVDKLTCAMYGRASTLEEKDCDIALPSIDDDNTMMTYPFKLLDVFLHLIKLCTLLGHVLKNIYYVRSLQYTTTPDTSVLSTWNSKLHQWKDQLPDSLQINNNGAIPPPAVCQLHMIYHTTIILLHRPFIPVSSLQQQHSNSASICSSAADNIIATAMSMFSENKLRYVWNFATYYIFTSGMVFIKNSTTTALSLDAKFKARQCLQVLDEIEHTWTTASKTCQILAELLGLRDSEFLRPKDNNNNNMDPFAAPNTIISSKPYDVLWDTTSEWNTTGSFLDPVLSYNHSERLIHADQYVDVLSGLPIEQATSPTSNALTNYLPHNNNMRHPSINAFYW